MGLFFSEKPKNRAIRAESLRQGMPEGDREREAFVLDRIGLASRWLKNASRLIRLLVFRTSRQKALIDIRDGVHEDLDKTRKAARILADQNRILREKLGRRTLLLRRVKASLGEAESQRRQNVELSCENNRLEAELHRARSRLRELEEEVARMSPDRDRSRKLESMARNLLRTVRRQKTRVGQLREAIRELRAERARLTSLKADLIALELRYRAVQLVNDGLKRQLESAQARSAPAPSALAEAQPPTLLVS